jgi:hypothetical protein
VTGSGPLYSPTTAVSWVRGFYNQDKKKMINKGSWFGGLDTQWYDHQLASGFVTSVAVLAEAAILSLLSGKTAAVGLFQRKAITPVQCYCLKIFLLALGRLQFF